MIRLADNKELVISALSDVRGSDCIKNTIRLYLDSYGVGYGFAEFYLNTNNGTGRYGAVILRYNSYVFCSVDEKCDFDELCDFLCGFKESSIFVDIVPNTNIKCFSNGEIFAVMSKKGVVSFGSRSEDIIITDDIGMISQVVTSGMTEQSGTDFFLNTSHQQRHGLLDIYAKISESIPVSIASVTKNSYNGIAVIPFVFTDKHFRGNGYSRQVLESITCNEALTYQLMCERKNIKFYEKCGFIQVDHCVRLRM